MIKNTWIAVLFFWGAMAHAQVVINELDTDTAGTDDKEFIELKSATANFALDAYVIVFYNGDPVSSTGLKSYVALDLDGFSTDANGIFVLGNQLVSPVPELITSNSTLQNGPDAVALYLGSASNFPYLTPATATNLVDALAYGTNATPPTELMTLLNIVYHTNENANALGTTQSIQRKLDGTYEVKTPTPGANNDGSGIVFNGVTISAPANLYNEGDGFDITFSTQTPVVGTLSFSFALANGTFDSADYSGSTNLSIPDGQTSVTTHITLIDDALDEGDELAKIKFGPLPTGYKRLNDNIEIRVIDNDWTTSAWGTPLNPTYGLVAPTISAGYYDSLEGKTGAVLQQAIQDVIANPAVVRAHTYGDVELMLKQADQNPLNSNEVWLMYVEQGRAKYRYQQTASSTGSWNREHIFPQSRGGFADGTSSTPDGIDIWAPTSAADINAGHSDGHHIRAEDGPENSSRGNRDYGLNDYNGPSGNQGSWHGDVARALFYMACRYNTLSVVNGNLPDSTPGQMGDLATLLVWNGTDPSDDFEMHHNNVIYNWQMNRNPFVDHPELADYIWGAQVGNPWFPTLGQREFEALQVRIYPNPAKDHFTIAGVNRGRIEIFDVSGMRLMQSEFTMDENVHVNLAAGVYFARIVSEGQSVTKKIIIE
ncbi:endonuclease [Flavobacterium caeni]|uniref:Por secretion system C-terminal sorting domain-containing protein n=1 Tax=Flavobacterium caeni TaxID=490189 RepID=A0A1G5JYQ5_9FLAO|nr:endonuclease [Flavobacterium caeni]SCY92990.1 Por secretion system C-terminal sorting domain-containing protein [Flavobacterium caeni]